MLFHHSSDPNSPWLPLRPVCVGSNVSRLVALRCSRSFGSASRNLNTMCIGGLFMFTAEIGMGFSLRHMGRITAPAGALSVRAAARQIA